MLGAQRSSIRLVEKAGFEAYVFDSSGRTVNSAGWETFLVASEPGAEGGTEATRQGGER